MSKYGAKRTELDGINFASKREAKRYSELKLLQAAGEIRDLELQVPVPLMGERDKIKTPTGRHMRYVADFRYFDARLNAWVIEDAKGFMTPEYKLKRAILAAMGLEIREV